MPTVVYIRDLNGRNSYHKNFNTAESNFDSNDQYSEVEDFDCRIHHLGHITAVNQWDVIYFILAAEILPQPWKAVFIVWSIISFVAIFSDSLLLILPWPDRLVDLLARFDFPPFYPLSPLMLFVFSVLSIVAGIVCGHVGMIVAGAAIISIFLILFIITIAANHSPDPSNLQND